MAAIRDPAFWKRFSVAVHLDEEKSITSSSTSTSSKRPEPKHSDTWLARQTAKRRRNRCLFYAFSLVFATLFTLVVLVMVWLSKHGWFMHGEAVTFP